MSAPQLSSTAVAQEPAKPIRDTLAIDHESRTIYFISGGKPRTLKPGERLRVPPSTQVLVIVTRTNSALYDYTVKREASAAPELTAVRTYLSGLGPYGTELSALLDGSPRQQLMATFCTPASRIISELQDLDRYLTGRGRDSTAAWSIADIRGKGLTALVQMSGLVQAGAADTSIETIARRYKGRLFIASGHRGQPRLAIVDDLINVLDSLRQSRRDIDDDIMCDRSMAAELRPKADQALEQADAILAAAYDTEKLALTIASAQSSVIVDTVTLSLDSALSLELEITPKARPELARLADPRPMTLGIGLRPRWRVVPAVGLALTYSPKSRFDTFGTRPARGDSADIVTPDLDDQRFGWALSLSLTPFGGLLDRNSPTPWLDLSVNPSDDVRGLGVGGAVSLRFIKVGTGLLWTKHIELNGQHVGQRLGTESDLRTRQTYGRGHWYLSVSLIGIPPFVK